MWEGNWLKHSPDGTIERPENWGVYSATEWKERFPVTVWNREYAIDFLSEEDYLNRVFTYMSAGYA